MFGAGSPGVPHGGQLGGSVLPFHGKQWEDCRDRMSLPLNRLRSALGGGPGRLVDAVRHAASAGLDISETGDTLRWDDFYRGPPEDEEARTRFSLDFLSAVRLEAEGSVALTAGRLERAEAAYAESAEIGTKLGVPELIARGATHTVT